MRLRTSPFRLSQTSQASHEVIQLHPPFIGLLLVMISNTCSYTIITIHPIISPLTQSHNSQLTTPSSSSSSRSQYHCTSCLLLGHRRGRSIDFDECAKGQSFSYFPQTNLPGSSWQRKGPPTPSLSFLQMRDWACKHKALPPDHHQLE